MAKKIRIGKDILTSIRVKTNGSDVALAGRDISVEIINARGYRHPVNNVSISDTNLLSFTFYGKDQPKTDFYNIVVWENRGKTGQTVVDTFNDYVELVPYTKFEGGSASEGLDTETVELTMNFSLGIIDHTQLTNRNANNQHPISSITGLENALNGKADKEQGGAIRINASLYYYSYQTDAESFTARKLFLRAPKGTINQTTDILKFARCKSQADNLQDITGRRRRKGWIRPHPHNDITLRYTKDEEFSTDEMDYFEILPSVSEDTLFATEYGGGDYDSWITLCEDMYQFRLPHSGRKDGCGGSGPVNLNCVCGICVERGGIMISDYMRFSVRYNEDQEAVGIVVTE